MKESKLQPARRPRRIESWPCGRSDTERRGRFLLTAALVILHACSPPGSSPGPPPPSALPRPDASWSEPDAGIGPELKLTVVVDNDAHDKRLEAMWGFACLVEGLEKTVLFDTGGEGATLLGNMKKLGIDPAKIDAVMLSHHHGDHVGGLTGFLEENSDVIVYLPASFSGSFKKKIRSLGAKVHEVSAAEELFPGAHTTGKMGQGIEEQSLVLETGQGLVVVTGCAHPGIESIVRRAKDMLAGKPVALVIGGFHLSAAATPHIEAVIEAFRQLGVNKVAPCHCSGDKAHELFEKEYGEQYVGCGAGRIITLP
jgi:7,8-dihydropterin-6-yl-methyl-4-(beta-D-ribofuranosyl)aminobenzene 5'-phosphate synthase